MFPSFAVAGWAVFLLLSVHFNLDQDHNMRKAMIHVLAIIIIAWETPNILVCVI